jgi:hypothetical protein
MSSDFVNWPMADQRCSSSNCATRSLIARDQAVFAANPSIDYRAARRHHPPNRMCRLGEIHTTCIARCHHSSGHSHPQRCAHLPAGRRGCRRYARLRQRHPSPPRCSGSRDSPFPDRCQKIHTPRAASLPVFVDLDRSVSAYSPPEREPLIGLATGSSMAPNRPTTAESCDGGSWSISSQACSLSDMILSFSHNNPSKRSENPRCRRVSSPCTGRNYEPWPIFS